MNLSAHPFYTCDTGHTLIIELSKILHDTGYVVVLPEFPASFRSSQAESEKSREGERSYFIGACDGSKFVKSTLPEASNGVFVIFMGGEYGCVMVSCLTPCVDKTNWHLYGERLIAKLTELKDKVMAGKLAISVTYTAGQVIPKMELIHVDITMNIKS